MNNTSQVVMTLLMSVSLHAAAADNNIGQWGVLTVENDAFGIIDTNDNDYSNGIGYAWGYERYDRFDDIDMPNWLSTLFALTYIRDDDGNSYALDYAVAQGMFTPDDLSAEELIEDDRPYAGTLTWQGRLRNFGNNTSRSSALILGVVGPLALAEQSQKLVHGWIDAEEPKGWDNQIRNEPVFRVEGEYVNRFFDARLSQSLGFDTSLYGQAGVGNLKSNVGAGLVFRFGNDLDATYGYINPISTRSTSLIGAGNGFSWQLHAAIYGQYVFNDITIDGNTFKDSHSVDLIHGQDILSLGFSLRWHRWGFDFSTQQGSKQYEGQISDSNFGSASFSYYF